SVVVLPYAPKDIATFQRAGNDLILQLHNGRAIRIANFYVTSANGIDNDLVLQDDNGTLWHGTHSEGLADFSFFELHSVDQLITGSDNFNAALFALGALGAAGAVAAAAAASDGDDDSDSDSDSD